MKIKTAKLTGVALDYVVTSLERPDFLKYGIADWRELRRHHVEGGEYVCRWHRSWMQGGPIIEREKITLLALSSDWEAQSSATPMQAVDGPTPLIAAMRCYVASKLGDEVEVPDELA